MVDFEYPNSYYGTRTKSDLAYIFLVAYQWDCLAPPNGTTFVLILGSVSVNYKTVSGLIAEPGDFLALCCPEEPESKLREESTPL